MGVLDRLLGRTELPELRTPELVERLARTPSPVLIEALSAHAYEEGHLPGALNLPRAKVEKLAPTLLPDRSAELVVYCKGPD